MKICIAGKNNIAVSVLEYVINELKIDKIDIFAICNKTDIGIDTWQRSYKKYCLENNVNIVSLEDLYGVRDLVFLSLEFDRLIKPDLFETNNIFNIHFSLLPKYKGMYTSIMPILNNEKYTGVTLHEIDRGIDTGDIIDQVKILINFYDNSRDVYHKYIDAAICLMKSNLERLLSGKYSSKPQAYEESTYYSKYSLNFSNITIDMNQTALNIHNQIRAFNFREYQTPVVYNKQVISSTILSNRSTLKPGTLVREDKISMTISSIDFDIVIYKDIRDVFLSACANNDVNLVSDMLKVPNILNIQNERGWTPLIVSAYNLAVEVFEILLVSGADSGIKGFNGTTLLMYAKDGFTKYGDARILDKIMSFDKNIYAKDYKGLSVVDYCIINNQHDIAKYIVDKVK